MEFHQIDFKIIFLLSTKKIRLSRLLLMVLFIPKKKKERDYSTNSLNKASDVSCLKIYPFTELKQILNSESLVSTIWENYLMVN